jgi:hypothetical protein
MWEAYEIYPQVTELMLPHGDPSKSTPSELDELERYRSPGARSGPDGPRSNPQAAMTERMREPSTRDSTHLATDLMTAADAV